MGETIHHQSPPKGFAELRVRLEQRCVHASLPTVAIVQDFERFHHYLTMDVAFHYWKAEYTRKKDTVNLVRKGD